MNDATLPTEPDRDDHRTLVVHDDHAVDPHEPAPVAMKRYQLLARCQIDGQLRDPGYITVKPADWRGPHRTVVSQHEIIHAGEPGTSVPLTGQDEPLYVEVPDEAIETIEERHALERHEMDQRHEAERVALLARQQDEIDKLAPVEVADAPAEDREPEPETDSGALVEPGMD